MKKVQVVRTHTSPYQGPDFGEREKKALEALGVVYSSPEKINPDLTTVLITNTHTELHKLPAILLKKTSLILHPNSGYDHFVQDIELWKNIPVIIGHKIRAQAVAEYSLSCLFQGLVELPQHLMWDKNRRWDRKLLGDLTVTVFGYGHIGKLITDTLRGLGTKVIVVDPYVNGCAKSWKETKLSESHAVIVACGLNETSREMFHDNFFKNVSKDLVFINGARGKLVKEKSLKDFLLTHPEAFAFLDVFAEEPFTTEWYNFPQVWKTSHIAGVSESLDQKLIDFEVEVLNDFLQGINLSQKYQHEILQNKFRQGVLI